MKIVNGEGYVLTKQDYENIIKRDDGTYFLPFSNKRTLTYIPTNDDLEDIKKIISNGLTRK